MVLDEEERTSKLLPHVRASWTLRGTRPQVLTPDTNRTITVPGRPQREPCRSLRSRKRIAITALAPSSFAFSIIRSIACLRASSRTTVNCETSPWRSDDIPPVTALLKPMDRTTRPNVKLERGGDGERDNRRFCCVRHGVQYTDVSSPCQRSTLADADKANVGRYGTKLKRGTGSSASPRRSRRARRMLTPYGESLLHRVGLDPPLDTREGLGERLVTYLIEQQRKADGTQKFYLWVLDYNTPAIRLYERMGFKRTWRASELPETQFLQRSTAIWLMTTSRMLMPASRIEETSGLPTDC